MRAARGQVRLAPPLRHPIYRQCSTLLLACILWCLLSVPLWSCGDVVSETWMGTSLYCLTGSVVWLVGLPPAAWRSVCCRGRSREGETAIIDGGDQDGNVTVLNGSIWALASSTAIEAPAGIA